MVDFAFTLDAERQAERFFEKQRREIILLTVSQLLGVEQARPQRKKPPASAPGVQTLPSRSTMRPRRFA
jgi:hypothetical protein